MSEHAGSNTAPLDPAANGWRFEPEDGFIGLVGPIWTRQDEPLGRFGFLAEPRHANMHGVVQGGMLMTFADRALGMLAWDAAGGPAMTISFDMAFAGPAPIGRFIELDGEVVQATRGLVFLRGKLSCDGRPVGSAQGTWRILSRRGTPPA